MKRNIAWIFLMGILIGGLTTSCEKDSDEFEPVNDEIYQIDTIVRTGCFGRTDIPDNEIISNNNVVIQRIDETSFLADLGQVYNCYATDSISLKGNHLDIFLKSDDTNPNCQCSYKWGFIFTMVEDKGLRARIYTYEESDYQLESELISFSIKY